MRKVTSQRRDQGQTAAEYLGVIVVVAAVVGVLASAGIGGQLATSIGCTIRSIVTQSGSCGAAVPPVTSPGAGASDTSSTGTSDTDSSDATPPIDQASVDAAREDIRDALDGGWNGVRSGELSDIEDVLDGLSGPELDAVLSGMTDAELRHWVDELDDGWVGSGWSRERRQELWSMIAAKASRPTLERLARFTDEIQPDFSQVGGDDARDDPNNPVNQAGYDDVPHQLFVSPDGGPAVDPTDLEQGYLGDCWMIASLGAIAQQRPDLIESMIRENANGTYTVTLHDGDRTVQVTVTPDLPTVDGNPIFVDNPSPSDAGEGVHELWPQILEKAAAQYYGDYTDLEGDWPSKALELFTGAPTTTYDEGWLPWDGVDPPSADDLAGVLHDRGAILVSTYSDQHNALYENQTLVSGHAYYVQSVDPAAGTVTVVNPWGLSGHPPITISYQDFVDSFRRVDVSTLEGN